MKQALALSAAAFILVGAGCGDDDDDTANERPKTTATQAAQPALEASGNRAVDAAPGHSVRRPSFRMPSRNIGCQMLSIGTRCDIRRRSYRPPRRPGNCDLEWGDAIELGRRGRASFSCHGDTAIDPSAPILPYGSESRVGRFVCQSRTVGVTCRNRVTGRGFFLAADRYRLF